MENSNSRSNFDKSNIETEQKDTAELHTDFTKNRSTDVYHYEAPNLTSMLYEYTNKEQEYINRCFRTGNYTTLREMPNDFTGGTFFKNDPKAGPTLGSILEQQNSDVKPKGAGARGSKANTEIKFEYMADDYDAFLDTLKQEKKESKEKQHKLHKDKDFNQYKGNISL